MNCPIDQTPLAMAERNGIEIDYCPTCRGVWLDRGELDKIIERSESEAPARQVAPPVYQQQPQYRAAPQQYASHDSHSKHGKKHWLSELFD